ncbi:MAG TPA: transposase [Candidatus Methylomirabilis sp.]|nr:transposase [Candidatus Methylomirabilis sp.]
MPTIQSTQITLNRDQPLEDYAAFVALDWADRKHDWSLQVAGQSKKETGTLEQTPEAIGAWVAKLRERFGGRSIALAVEQSRGALLHALMSYDFIVTYPLPSTMVAKFREAFKPSGAKNDPLDTNEALEILTKHRDQLRPLRPDTEPTRLLRRLVEDRRKAVDQRTGHVQALGASLKEYYPQALQALNGNLTSRLAADFLEKWPTFEDFQQAKPQTIRKFYYGHNIRSPEVLQQALDLAAKGKPLTSDAAIVESGRRLSQVHARIIQTLNPLIADYDQRINTLFTQHDEAKLFAHLPGAGPALAPRLLAFFGTDRSHYPAAQNVQSFTGIAPVTKSSGRSRVVHFRLACPKFDRQTFHEFARLSVPNCQWAQNYVTYYTDKGKEYHAIIRALAYKWIRILFRCWQNRTPYDEVKYMKNLQKRGSRFATLHLAKKS